jgi:hypothetical protein
MPQGGGGASGVTSHPAVFRPPLRALVRKVEPSDGLLKTAPEAFILLCP